MVRRSSSSTSVKTERDLGGKKRSGSEDCSTYHEGSILLGVTYEK